jgi:hypothetical protein
MVVLFIKLIKKCIFPLKFLHLLALGSGSGFPIRIRIHKVTESWSNPDPQPCFELSVVCMFRKLIQKKRSRIGSSEEAGHPATRRPDEEEPRGKRRLAARRRRHHAQAQGEDQFPAPFIPHWTDQEVPVMLHHVSDREWLKKGRCIRDRYCFGRYPANPKAGYRIPGMDFVAQNVKIS